MCSPPPSNAYLSPSIAFHAKILSCLFCLFLYLFFPPTISFSIISNFTQRFIRHILGGEELGSSFFFFVLFRNKTKYEIIERNVLRHFNWGGREENSQCRRKEEKHVKY